MKGDGRRQGEKSPCPTAESSAIYPTTYPQRRPAGADPGPTEDLNFLKSPIAFCVELWYNVLRWDEKR